MSCWEKKAAHNIEFYHALYRTPSAPASDLPSSSFGDILRIAGFRSVEDEDPRGEVILVEGIGGRHQELKAWPPVVYTLDTQGEVIP